MPSMNLKLRSLTHRQGTDITKWKATASKEKGIFRTTSACLCKIHGLGLKLLQFNNTLFVPSIFL